MTLGTSSADFYNGRETQNFERIISPLQSQIMEQAVCITNFKCVTLGDQVHAAVCASNSSSFSCRICRSAEVCVFGRFWSLFSILRVRRQLSKGRSVTRKHILVHSNELSYTSLWFYCSEFGRKNQSKCSLFDQKLKLYDTTLIC